MKEKIEPRCVIQRNARLVAELHRRVHETFRVRTAKPEGWDAWSRACDEFHKQFDELAFPGGYEAGLQKIQEGDPDAIENALAFLEVRPYFFRSQYMRTKLIRLLKRARLTRRQTQRFEKELASQKENRRRRKGRSS